MNEEIIHTINGKKYILMEDLVADSYEDSQEKIKKFNGIILNIRTTNEIGLFKSSSHLILKFLIPVENIEKWNKM